MKPVSFPSGERCPTVGPRRTSASGTGPGASLSTPSWWTCRPTLEKHPVTKYMVEYLTCKVLLDWPQYWIGQHNKIVWPGATLEVCLLCAKRSALIKGTENNVITQAYVLVYNSVGAQNLTVFGFRMVKRFWFMVLTIQNQNGKVLVAKHFRPSNICFWPVFKPPIKNQAIWQPKMFGLVKYQTCLVFRWLLFLIF